MIIKLQMAKGFDRTVDKLGSMGRDVIEACSKGLDTGVKNAAGHVSANFLMGQALKSRTGLLAKAVTGWLEGKLDGVVGVRPGTAVDKYKWLLGDEQKTITPKNAKFLAIPIGENLTGAGVVRKPSPRDVPDGFFVKTKGKLLFGYKKGKRGKFRPLFTLVKSVLVQGSGALADGVMDSIDDITAAMQTEIAKVTKA